MNVEVMEAWHHMEAHQVLERLGSSAGTGLSSECAADRLAASGPNEIPKHRVKSLWAVFAGQFSSPLIYLLLFAATISLALGKGWDAAVILSVVLVNAGIGTLHERRADLSLAALKKLTQTQAVVLRDGAACKIPSRELVPGDILVLGAGDAVGADARLLGVSSLQVNEAVLTGEAFPVEKRVEPVVSDAPLGDRASMVFSGSHVTQGGGRAVVVATGLATEIGKVAVLTSGAAPHETPLEGQLRGFGRSLAAVSVVLFGVVLGLGLWRGGDFPAIFMVAISQMVSTVPEGLPVALTVALAIGTRRMAARGAIIRRLAAVETLGATTVICSDKTGTLTRNEISVTRVFLPDGTHLHVDDSGGESDGFRVERGHANGAWMAGLRPLLEACALCNDARLLPPDPMKGGLEPLSFLGDPTEAALLVLARRGGISPAKCVLENPRESEDAFNSGTKMMVTWHRSALGRRCFSKGAPEAILARCKLAVMERARIEDAVEGFAAAGLRVLAFARGAPQGGDGFEFLGLVGERDSVRPEAIEAISACRAAGIRVVMVTGDHQTTGLAVARELGIALPGQIAVDGAALERLPEQDLREMLPRVSVFARMHPAQKLRVVRAFQDAGHIVAMTGDGVNDAPALAAADVGVAMGRSGTEVAKEASKIVISDDNFATIVSAVEEGRLVHRNLRKVLLFLFATSVDEVLILLLAIWTGLIPTLAAVQILWINIVTEGVVTVNLIMEGLEGDEMRSPPVVPGGSLISGEMLKRLAVMVISSVSVIFGFSLLNGQGGVSIETVRTEVFTLVAVTQWFNVLNCRSATRSALRLDVLGNPWLWGGLLGGACLQFAAVYLPPLNNAFQTVPIPGDRLLQIILAGSTVLWVEEFRKWITRHAHRKKRGLWNP